jgi:arsenate reductase-like glutaredoxin family protein
MVSKKAFLENLEKSSLEFLESGNEDYLNSIIEDNGGNVAEVEQRGENLYKRLSFLNKATTSKATHDELLLTVVHKFKEGLEKNLEKPVATLRQLIQEKPQLLRARNLDKLNEDDIRELIKGHNLVELLNSLTEK